MFEKHFFREISEGGGGESNGWMLKRSKTGPVYFQLKETFLGRRWCNITHTNTLSWRFGSDGPCKWMILCFGGNAVILHTHIYTFMEICVKGAMQKDHLRRTN